MRSNDYVFVGLDIETTGSDIYAGHAICQVGVYVGPTYGKADAFFVSDIGPDPGTPVTEEAMKVNGFTLERLNEGPRNRVVDEQLSQWLDANVDAPRGRGIIPIGWNVAGFDMAFIRRYLPLTAERLSYRSVDLNAVCFTLDIHKWEKWKKHAKKYADTALKNLGWDLKPHDALFDAAHAYYAWSWLCVMCMEVGYVKTERF